MEALENDLKKFVDELPYWAKFLADKILSGKPISDDIINASYSFLLEELKLTEETERPEINIDYNPDNAEKYKSSLILTKLEDIEWVNALTEKQKVEFSPNLTVIYGANGSWKSGYVRLLKDVFYSKSPEDILQNIYLDTGHKDIDAKFTFKSDDIENTLTYVDKDCAEFEQFSVFDGKSVLSHLEDKNEFEFRPAGLSFFADYTNTVNQVEQKLNTDIQTKSSWYKVDDFITLFDGNSEIKTIIQGLSAETNIDELKKYIPFSDDDKTKKEAVQKQYDELLLASKWKEKEIKNLETIKTTLIQNKEAIEKINQFFKTDTFTRLNKMIAECIDKQVIAKAEGIENFKTDKIEDIWTEEWKNFIIAAEVFAKKQKADFSSYPEVGDNCLFCHQPLSTDAQQLIWNYWVFIKSIAEQNAKDAQEKIDTIRKRYENLNFDLFPQENILTAWLNERYPTELEALKQKLLEQKDLAQWIISDIQKKSIVDRDELLISIEPYAIIEEAINSFTNSLKGDEQLSALSTLSNTKIFLEHKEKLNTHFAKFESFIKNQIWIKQLQNANFAKRKITETEKALSDKYFNQRYVLLFSEECIKLNWNFGIEVNHTGSAGKSFRQLKLKWNTPNVVLSEGEQKVIAIADFLTEMQLSEINKWIIFDDPVSSLDNDRKYQVAERLVMEACSKQVIIFTHDLVFFSYLKNFSSRHLSGIQDSFLHHSLEKDSKLSGKVIANSSPANEGQYNNPTKAKEWLQRSKTAQWNDKVDYAKSGLWALRSSYEALAIFTILWGTVQRFDPQIRMGRLKEVKYEKALIDKVIEKHGEISNLIEGHLPSDELGIIASPEILEQQISDFETLKESIKNITY